MNKKLSKAMVVAACLPGMVNAPTVFADDDDEKNSQVTTKVSPLATTANANEVVLRGVSAQANESLDDWMPSKALQDMVIQYLSDDLDQDAETVRAELTPEFAATHDLIFDYRSMGSGDGGNNGAKYKAIFSLPSEDFKGLEKFQSIQFYLQLMSPDSVAFFKANPVNVEAIASLTNAQARWIGDLTTIFPNGIDFNNSQFTYDINYNVYRINDVHLTKDNYKSFFVSYEDLGILNPNPDTLNINANSVMAIDGKYPYNVSLADGGLLFTLQGDVPYENLAGKSFVNTEAGTSNVYALADGPNLTVGQYRVKERFNIYYALQAADVTINYVDTAGNPLKNSDTQSGNVGDAYTTEPATIDGYRLKTTPGNASGTFTDQPQTVTYVYERADAAPVTVHYQDEDGKDIANAETKTGKVGDSYTTNPATIDGYTLKAKPDNATGTFTNQPQTVTYVYERADAAPVTINYQDETGTDVAKAETKTGKIGDSYTTNPVNIDGYSLKTTPTNASGTFTDQAQTVTYVYEKAVVSPVTVDTKDKTTDNLSKPETKFEKVDTGNTATPVKLDYTKNQAMGYTPLTQTAVTPIPTSGAAELPYTHANQKRHLTLTTLAVALSVGLVAYFIQKKK